MANKTIVMSKLRRLLQLHSQGKSKLFISKYLELSRNTVDKYILQYKLLDLPPEEIERLTDSDLDKLFFVQVIDDLNPRQKTMYAFFPYMEKELKKTGVTRQLMWEEYITRHPEGIRRSQFNEHYNKWCKKVNPVMHINHKAGDKMYVDYAGKTLPMVDKESGEIIQVQFFVAILGSSQYTYAEVTLSQSKEDFISSVENALHFFGGVPAAIVPDNLKSAVIKSNRYEPTLNETFLDFAEHYGTTVLPARSYKPRDKSLVEGMVKILYTRVYSAIRDKTFFSLKEINMAISEPLEVHNSTKLTARPYTRLDLFNEVEKQVLSPLPDRRYELKQLSFATVMLNGHVLLGQDKHYYSVPYQFIRKKVKLLYSNSQVEVYYKYNRIALHQRVKKPYSYTTITEHLASTHKFITEWTPQRFINWAESIDGNVKEYIIQILNKKQHPEQSYKSCMGVLSLVKKVGEERLKNACKRAIEYNMYSYKTVQNILERGLDQVDNDNQPVHILPEHNNIRGKDYYK
jgi:transposase